MSATFPRSLRTAGALALALFSSGCPFIVNRLAFHPQKSAPLSADTLPSDTRIITITSDDGEKLESLLVAGRHPGRLVIYFQGNAGNIAQRLPELHRIAEVTGASVLGAGFRGYGASTGSPSEQGLYRDGAAALRYARDTLHLSEDNIFICGRSIGSTVAVHVARHRNLAGLILITPLSTGREAAQAHGMTVAASLAGNAFDNLSRAPEIVCPVLVIHGTDDEVIPYAHGQRLHAAITAPKHFVTIEGGRHNDLEFTAPETYWHAIADFTVIPPHTTLPKN